MPKFKGIRVGMAILPADDEARDTLKKIPERKPYNVNVPVPRVQKAHDLFFAVVSDACEHWPDGHEPQPDGDTEVLRAWLLCRIGWCEWRDYPLSENERANQVTAASVDADMRDAKHHGTHPFLRSGQMVIDGEKMPTLRVYRSKSISHDLVDEVQFREIKSAVFEVIEEVVGVDVQVFIDAYHERKAREAAARAA